MIIWSYDHINVYIYNLMYMYNKPSRFYSSAFTSVFSKQKALGLIHTELEVAKRYKMWCLDAEKSNGWEQWFNGMFVWNKTRGLEHVFKKSTETKVAGGYVLDGFDF